MVKNNQLKIGTRIESEHKRTVKFIRGYVKKYRKVPSNKMIFSQIAKDHLQEHKDYYKRLRRAKL